MTATAQFSTAAKALKLITFDATNTFLHFSRPVYEQYAHVARRYDVVVEHPQQLQQHFEQAYGKHWKSRPNFGCMQTHASPTKQSTSASQRWWLDVVRDTFLLGGYVDSAQSKKLDAVAAHLYRHFCNADAWRLDVKFPSVLETLRMQHPSTKFGVISNFDERLPIILRSVGCLHLFDFVLTSVAAGAAKPSAEIFNFALRNLAALERPETALHVGNDLKRDYHGALNAGWNALLYAPSQAVPDNRSNADDSLASENRGINTIEHLSDLIGYVNQNFQSETNI